MRRKRLLWCLSKCQPGEAVGPKEKGLLENNPEMASTEGSPKLSLPHLAAFHQRSRAGQGGRGQVRG